MQKRKKFPIAPNLNNQKILEKLLRKLLLQYINIQRIDHHPLILQLMTKQQQQGHYQAQLLLTVTHQIAHTIPPTIAAIIPDIGGAFEAKLDLNQEEELPTKQQNQKNISRKLKHKLF